MRKWRILCWNVNGFRAVQKKGFQEWINRESPDILCLQETKVHPEQLEDKVRTPGGYYTYWNHPGRKGYGGVSTFTKEKPLKVENDLDVPGFDTEGRVIRTEHPGFTLFNIYFPNGKQGPERLKYKMEFYDHFLNVADELRSNGTNVVVCGDFNTAHKETDIARPKENTKYSGFLPEERAWMDKLVAHGFVDAFRHFHPEPAQYTWWDVKSGARARNVGWRIDYFFVSDKLLPSLKEAFHLTEVMGSDHCPVGIVLEESSDG